jgi:hypothetical protein
MSLRRTSRAERLGNLLCAWQYSADTRYWSLWVAVADWDALRLLTHFAGMPHVRVQIGGDGEYQHDTSKHQYCGP